jgi:hypothetical protein
VVPSALVPASIAGSMKAERFFRRRATHSEPLRCGEGSGTCGNRRRLADWFGNGNGENYATRRRRDGQRPHLGLPNPSASGRPLTHAGGTRRITVGDAIGLHRKARRVLDRLLAAPRDRRKVVVTHHAPHPVCLPPDAQSAWVAGISASDLSGLIEGGQVDLRVAQAGAFHQPGAAWSLCYRSILRGIAGTGARSGGIGRSPSCSGPKTRSTVTSPAVVLRPVSGMTRYSAR